MVGIKCGECGTVFNLPKKEIMGRYHYKIQAQGERIECPSCGKYMPEHIQRHLVDLTKGLKMANKSNWEIELLFAESAK